MKKTIKRKTPSVKAKDQLVEPNLVDKLQQQSTAIEGKLVDKLQQQLTAIEGKLDILINQSSKKPFERDYSQKSSHHLSHNRYDRPRQDRDSRERTYTRVICAGCNKECEIPFKPIGGRPVYCKECFSKRNKENSFSAGRDNRFEKKDFSRERHFDKKHKSVNKNKPFFARSKKRA
ncbi:MAG: hypothetical protein P9L96_02915 [Candidatus Gygaella obscura]|nr:hypothetical protein [Candidatus Gygaella obscura]